jgi:hypothetical protein
MQASQEGHLDIVKLLLDKGASVNAANKVESPSVVFHYCIFRRWHSFVYRNHGLGDPKSQYVFS